MEETLYKIILAIGGLGLFLTYVGWFRRRYDGGLYCRRCGYRVDRSGETVERCSECGSELTGEGRRVLPYQRQRNLVIVAFGMMLVMGTGFVVMTDATRRISAADVYRLLPNWILLRADVSASGDFADEQVTVLRNRVQNAGWDERKFRSFTKMLCVRATNLHRQALRNQMQYTGMTMSLLKDYKPSDLEVDELLETLVGRLLDGVGAAVDLADGKTIRVFVPEMQCDPSRPFLGAMDLTSVRMRGEIAGWQLEQGSAVVPPNGQEWIPGRGWVATFEKIDVEARVLRLKINWFIESETLPLPRADEVGVANTATPWHTFEMICDLRLEPPGEFGGSREIWNRFSKTDRSRYLLVPKSAMN